MRKFIILGTILLSTFSYADDVKQKTAIAEKLVSVDGTEQGLENTDKMILEQIRMRLPKDMPSWRGRWLKRKGTRRGDWN